MPSTHQIAVLAALFGALAGCRPRDAAHRPTPAADLIVSVAGGRVTAPDSIGPGWLRLRVEEDGAGHIIVLFRLRDGDTDPAALLQALDTARSTPILATALGGPEVGDTGEVVMQVTPGRSWSGVSSRDRMGADTPAAARRSCWWSPRPPSRPVVGRLPWQRNSFK